MQFAPGNDALTVAIGWDAREEAAYQVARHSLLRHATIPVQAVRLVLSHLQGRGLYTRPLERRPGGLWDPVSQAPMSTEFAISRFFLPWMAGTEQPVREGWALFVDGDVLFRRDVADLWALRDPRFALQVVKHQQQVGKGERKMDGQPQTAYPRKNWSSVVLWNLAHPAHQRLDLDMLNHAPGRDLHGFCWLASEEIGSLPAEWNWLEGYGDPAVDPALVHYTRGGPWMPGWDHVEYAGAWREEAGRVMADMYRRAAA